MTISSTDPVAWWTTTELVLHECIYIWGGSVRGKHWLEIWQSHDLWHFSELWNLLCQLHKEIILVGPSIVTTEQNSDPTKYNGLSSIICKGGHYVLCHELCSKRIYAVTMWKGGHYIYRTKYQALSKAKIYGTLCNFVHRAIRDYSAIDICPLWVKKLHVLLFLVELKPTTWRK